MHKRVLEELGFSVPVLGMWRINTLTRRQLDQLIRSAVDHNITSFDHADIYGDYSCEEFFGSWMADNRHLREDMKLISKCGINLLSEKYPNRQVKHYDTSKKHIIGSVDASLQKLRTDYLDLLLIHRPDPLMQPDEVAEAFDGLLRQGKVKSFGVSNFSPTQFDLLQQACDMPLVTNQIEVSLVNSLSMFDGTLDHLMFNGCQPMAWSPLGGQDRIRDVVADSFYQEMANKYGVTIGDLFLAWLMQHPAAIIPVIGTMNPERVATASRMADMDLEREDWFALLEKARGFRVP